MKKYLKISNYGQLEPEALSLLGASTKVGDSSKIGMFGSGNKYAIAYLIRNNYELKIFSDYREIKVSTVKKNFRDEEFDVICINDKETSITTKMGKQWKLWEAIRELYSNAIDEGLKEFSFVDEVKPTEDTTFYIGINQELEDLIKNFDDYFLMKKTPKFENKYGRIYNNKKAITTVFRKGIRCYTNIDKNCIFTYDFDNLEINETREVRYAWEIYENIANLILSCTNKEIIEEFLNNIYSSDYFERMVFESSLTDINKSLISDEFKEVLNRKNICPDYMVSLLSKDDIFDYYILPKRLYLALVDYIERKELPNNYEDNGFGTFYKKIEKNRNEKIDNRMIEVMEFLEGTEYISKYPIEVVDFPKKNVYGTIQKNPDIILLSELALEESLEMAVNTIIEEYIHLKYGVLDETRAFQNAAIKEIINQIKENKK